VAKVKELQIETAQKCEIIRSMPDKKEKQEQCAATVEKLDGTSTQFAASPHKIFLPVDSSKRSATWQLNVKRSNHAKLQTVHKLFPPVWETINQYYRWLQEVEFLSHSSWMRHDLHQVGKSTVKTSNINNSQSPPVLCMKSVWCLACTHSSGVLLGKNHHVLR